MGTPGLVMASDKELTADRKAPERQRAVKGKRYGHVLSRIRQHPSRR